MMSHSKKLGAAATLASLACAAGCIADPASPAHFDSGASFSLKAGGQAQSRDGQVQVGFDGVSADSRCPKGVQCVWAGDATVRVWIRRGTGPKEHADLHTAAAAQQSLHSLGQQLSLLRLAPYPIAGKAIAAGDYVATLTLAPSAEAQSER